MGYLKINHDKVTPEAAKELVGLCPFAALNYVDQRLSVNEACKMCRICVKRGPAGIMEFVEEYEAEIDKSMWRGICVYADHEDGEIHPVTFELIGKARQLASVTKHPVYVLMIGSNLGRYADKILSYGVDKIFLYDDPALRHFIIGPYTNCFADFIKKIKPSSILVGATNVGRSLAPRIAARFRTGLTADCTKLEMREDTDLVQIRPAFGGNIMAQILTKKTRPQLCTVRYKIFSAPEPETPHGEVVNMGIAKYMLKSDTEITAFVKKQVEVDISEADVIVAVGRGLKSKADIAMVEELAGLLNAKVASTRPLVEAGWIDPRHQIGLSGRTVKPKLIIALGISGAVQFTAGMDGSEKIVAVNTDPNAPIFGIAHYGIVGDIYEVVPKLIEKIKNENK